MTDDVLWFADVGNPGGRPRLLRNGYGGKEELPPDIAAGLVLGGPDGCRGKPERQEEKLVSFALSSRSCYREAVLG